jgi:exosortase/archaeosortase family protein
MYFVIYFNLSFEPLQVFLASSTSNVLRFFGYPTRQVDYFLKIFYSKGVLEIEISWDSTGWKSIYLLTALTLAVPFRKIKSKIIFLLIGIPIIFLINFIRILTTILISLNYGIKYFDIIHIFLWREGLIFAVLILWFTWLKTSYKIKN